MGILESLAFFLHGKVLTGNSFQFGVSPKLCAIKASNVQYQAIQSVTEPPSKHKMNDKTNYRRTDVDQATTVSLALRACQGIIMSGREITILTFSTKLKSTASTNSKAGKSGRVVIWSENGGV